MATLVKKSKPLDTEQDYLPNTRRIAAIAADKKALNIRAYDVFGLTVIADAFVICSVTSEPQMKGVVNAVREGMKEIGVAPLRTEGAVNGGWILMDYGAIIFHVFRQQSREFYDLDGMWADAKEIALGL